MGFRSRVGAVCLGVEEEEAGREQVGSLAGSNLDRRIGKEGSGRVLGGKRGKGRRGMGVGMGGRGLDSGFMRGLVPS